jgi:hypothetical protein
MKILIGNTGLVGQTLKESINFDFEYNSKSIHSYSPPDGCDLYLSCLPSTKWLINKDTKTDIETIVEIIKLIGNVKYKNVYLISTIDVYGNSPIGVDEDFDPIFKDFSYGSNRYLFEKMVVKHLIYENVKVFRLPALFSKNIKKNILYDLLHNNNIHMINKNSSFQWYNLNDLVGDISLYDEKHPNEVIFNLFTEPLESEEIINLFPTHKEKVANSEIKILYDYTTKYSSTGYIKPKETILNEIKKLVNEITFK